jgi:peroxiredoxin (alkyl hydroperoxide reductase subunit C)
MASPQIGERAPDFDLPALIGGVKKRFRLGDQLSKSDVVIVFYPYNWEAISGSQMVQYQAEREMILARSAEVVGISVDSIMNTTVWEREIGPFDFPLCSDFWPHGHVARMYGVFSEQEPHLGTSERSIFVVDKNGIIRFRNVYSFTEQPPFDELISALSSLRSFQ